MDKDVIKQYIAHKSIEKAIDALQSLYRYIGSTKRN
jgi:hypothetical protein